MKKRYFQSLLLLALVVCGCKKKSHLSPRVIEEIPTHKISIKKIHEVQKPKEYAFKGGKSSHFSLHHFGCKGSYTNPQYTERLETGENVILSDCNGIKEHGLPLHEGKEFIYPVLINLVNHLQKKLGKDVVITSGHRCPKHNRYVDPSQENASSKHQIGAEVDFYIKGLEKEPEKVIQEVIAFYQSDTPEYKNFSRWDKPTNVSTAPWYNKEIFMKLSLPTEGRNKDNSHPFPYITLQVRFDRAANNKVNYSWPEANKNYLRK